MNAKEMFDSLGYELIVKDVGFIVYEYSTSPTVKITFYMEDMVYVVDSHGLGTPVTKYEHLAIHKQLLELGWL